MKWLIQKGCQNVVHNSLCDFRKYRGQVHRSVIVWKEGERRKEKEGEEGGRKREGGGRREDSLEQGARAGG